jgi:hypothetical protein
MTFLSQNGTDSSSDFTMTVENHLSMHSFMMKRERNERVLQLSAIQSNQLGPSFDVPDDVFCLASDPQADELQPGTFLHSDVPSPPPLQTQQ